MRFNAQRSQRLSERAISVPFRSMTLLKGCDPLSCVAFRLSPQLDAVSQNRAPLSSYHFPPTRAELICQLFPSSGSHYRINSLGERFYLPLREVTHALCARFADSGCSQPRGFHPPAAPRGPAIPLGPPCHCRTPRQSTGDGTTDVFPGATVHPAPASGSSSLAQGTQGHRLWDRQTYAHCTVLPWIHVSSYTFLPMPVMGKLQAPIWL